MTSAAPNDVVIIGGGLTGSTALYQLVLQYPARSITLLESARNC